MATREEQAPVTGDLVTEERIPAKMARHPTVQRLRRHPAGAPEAVTAAWLREVSLAAGVDDVGFVSIERPEMAEERPYVEEALPGVRTLISIVVRMNRDNIRSPARSVANREFHQTSELVDEAAREIVQALAQRGHRAVNPSMAFPMEMDRYPGRAWVVSHKRVAVAAGLGQMGLHRNVIHPRFGNFILLATVLTDARVEEEGQPVDYNPCIDCKLCVAACPVGAIHPDGHFDFSGCSTHNYREFMGGFINWVEAIADSKNGKDYRDRVSDSETASMWQSLSYKPNYKAAYCLAVCPAGEDVLSPFLRSRGAFMDQVLRPLQQKEEILYVLAGSDAEAYARKRFPHKRLQRVTTSMRPRSVKGFLGAMPRFFQRGRAKDLTVSVRFSFTGAEQLTSTARIVDGALSLAEDDVAPVDVEVTADANAWLEITRGRSPLKAMLLGRLRLRGDRKQFKRFMRCIGR
ncbi:4Fe-4S ferredoxin [Cystobacter fuscus]|uniref:4Fe-4S ferredoxin n=1 Tax=Cystobacter fuscus TaxID=43 RepID=A0A250IYL4_9BACT|nr:SCP2 sterol-binding domain-containing protein [Cystobacter fuscus]ATB36835.1 4Fe-4S ferredoxin [Cystobacter fuscus]